MNNKKRHIPIILASTSPRRIDLMKQVRLNVEVVSPDTDEQPKKGEKPKSLVGRLAQEKAESVFEYAIQHHSQSLIIAADTIVVAPNRLTVLGKPRNKAEAAKMLSMLSGNIHEVLTGYCILHATQGKSSKTNSKTAGTIEKKIVKVVHSKVKMRKLDPKLIRTYIDSGEPMDKAGSYGAQGMGMALIERLDGNYTNVVGLPITQLLLDLEESFKMPLFSWTR